MKHKSRFICLSPSPPENAALLHDSRGSHCLITPVLAKHLLLVRASLCANIVEVVAQ